MLNPQEEVTSESEEAPLQQGTQTPNLQDEVTSDSQPEIVPVPKAKAKPKPKQPKREQLKRRRRIQALEPVARHTEETSSSGSIETKRLRAARAKWNTASTSTQTQAAEVTVTSESDGEAMQSMQFEAGCSTRPVTSGLFDFCDYIVQHILDEDGQTQIIKKPYCYMDFCAGLGTSVICTEAVRRSLQTVGKELDATCVCLTEKCPKKLAVLKRYNSGATIFADTTAAAEDLPRDCDSKWVERPCAGILFQGIVCVDISSLSSTPKSLLNKHGKSGQAWESTLTYLRKTPYEHRPKAMVLECVSNLSKRRAVDKCLKRGTEQVSEQLQEFGYVGRFVGVSSHKFFLPHHRPRVWGLFLKLSCGLGPKGVSEREAKVEKAFDFVSRCQLDSYEPLSDVLRRLRAEGVLGEPARPVKKLGKINQHRRTNFMQKHSLTEEDVLVGQTSFTDSFTDHPRPFLTNRELDDLWLKLCQMRKRGKIDSWDNGVFVASVGSSADFMTIIRGRFPCLTPGNKYVILEQGASHVTNGPMALAVQGIGGKEVRAFSLHGIDDSTLREMAGNAFTANICCTFLIATLLTI